MQLFISLSTQYLHGQGDGFAKQKVDWCAQGEEGGLKTSKDVQTSFIDDPYVDWLDQPSSLFLLFLPPNNATFSWTNHQLIIVSFKMIVMTRQYINVWYWIMQPLLSQSTTILAHVLPHFL